MQLLLTHGELTKKVLFTIYRSLIRSVIDYGALAYNSASNNLKQRLDVIQHKALRIACGAFFSTAASALQVETSDVPLSLRRSQQELKYIVKVKATKGHSAKPVTVRSLEQIISLYSQKLWNIFRRYPSNQ